METKRSFTMVFCLMLALSLFTIVSAEGTWRPDSTDKIDPELRNVIKDLDLGSYEVDFVENGYKFEYQNAIKLSGFSESIEMAKLATGKLKFKELISDYHTWLVPVIDGNGNRICAHITFWSQDDIDRLEIADMKPGWKLEGYSNKTSKQSNNDTFADLFNKDALVKSIPPNTSYKIVDLPSHIGMTVIYYEYNGIEYIIPYATKEWSPTIQVKSVYQTDTLMKEWDQEYAEVKIKSSEAGGYTNYSLEKRVPGYTKEMYLILLGIIGMLVSIIGLVIVFTYNKRRKMK